MKSFEKIFPWASLILAVYFLRAALWPFFPSPDITEEGRYVFLLLGVFFLVIPVSQKIEIFNFISFDRRLEEMKTKQVEQANEIKHLQSIQANLTAAMTFVSSNSNRNSATVNNYLGAQNADATAGALAETSSANTMYDIPALGLTSLLESGALNQPIALAITPLQDLLALSVSVRVALRQALKKSLDLYEERKPAKYLTPTRLYEMYLEQNAGQESLRPIFTDFFRIANAAENGQFVPDADLITALYLGRRLLSTICGTPTDGIPTSINP